MRDNLLKMHKMNKLNTSHQLSIQEKGGRGVVCSHRE